MSRAHRIAAASTAMAAATALLAGVLTATAVVTAGSATAASAPSAPAPSAAVVSEGVVGGLEVENSFVSAVGWVKPGDTYPSRVIVRNTSALPVTGATVAVSAPVGSTILKAGATTVDARSYTWQVGSLAAGASRTLVLESRADDLAQLPTIVWRDLSTTATVTVGGATKALTSHGPKVIPPGSEYDTARYGDRPFPVVPVAYTDRGYGTHERTLDTVINDPSYEGSTFNLFQEMSLGQLYPEGTVPSTGIDTADFTYAGNPATGGDRAFPFTKLVPGQTCLGGATFSDSPLPAEGTPLYAERIKDGVYQLPGTTGYYGSDGNGSAIIGSLAGVGALQQIDSGCGPTGKLVVDAAAIADPEIDYSDYDTDKDGVVDFFMAVFAGCGGNGASQLSIAGCDLPNPTTGTPDLPYDNVWPHSSSLEFYYSDPVTGLPGFTTDDQLKDLEGRPLWYTDDSYSTMTTTPGTDALKVFVRVGPYNLNPETAIDKASVISHEYGHSLGLPDFYSTGSRETYGDWNLMATDKSHNIDAFGRQELGWVVPEVLDSSRTETGITDSKQDTDTITWQTPNGSSYTLTEGTDGVGRVQNSQMYVAKLPGRVLLDPAKFDTGDTATASHTWWSRSGNDFGCATDGGGHNIDLAIPEVADLPEGTTLSLDLKSMWDIEWDYDYGFVLTSGDGGQDFVSHPSANGFTTSNTDPLAGNPNQNGCQAAYDNGITGTSGSYDAGTQATDRKLGETPEMVFLADSYDISDLVGTKAPVLRFSYATDPGLARPGWFIDDVVVTATLPNGSTREIYATDFETSGSPEDPRVFNGGCRADGPGGACGQGWQYVAAGAEGPSDHAYYLEMRDRSGFDLDGRGQIDRDPIAFASGFYAAYTDEAHGYGNAGTDDPPAQSPLDSQPEPGSDTPDLADAAWTAAAGDSHFSDGGDGWTDNYADPSSASGNWEFRWDCLAFDVLGMSGNGDGTVAGEGPAQSDGDLTGDVRFTLGEGCGTFDYGYGDEQVPPANTAPDARATATPTTGEPGTRVRLDASGSTDAETPGSLTYSWDLDNGGRTKDAEGAVVSHVFGNAGTYDATVTVSDASGLTDTATVRITITEPGTTPPSTPPATEPATSPSQPSSLTSPGSGQPTVATGTAAPDDLPRSQPCQGRSVGHLGSWRVVRGSAPGGSYCDNGGTRRGRDVLRLGFQGDSVGIVLGRARGGGKAVLFVDGERVGTISFTGRRHRPRLDRYAVVSGLGADRPHRLRLVVKSGRAFVEGFRTAR